MVKRGNKMKYIRTKDSILISRGEDFNCVFTSGGRVLKADVMKKADAIEALCDGFIAVTCTGFSVPYASFEDMLGHGGYDGSTNQERYERYVDKYGVIKNGGNLIYAAKLNKKGEMELL